MMREDWVETELGMACEINMGQSPPSSSYNDNKNGLPFFQGKAEFTELHPVARKWCDGPKKTAAINDILLSVRAPVGATNIADVKCSIGRGLAALTYKIKYVSQDTYEYWSRRYFPIPGDILFTREAPMGEATIIPPETKICLGQRMMLLKVFPDFLLPEYLLYNILSSTFQQRFIKDAIGTGVKHLRVGDVESLVFPLCSPSEQIKIVQEIESRLSVCDKVEETIKESLEKAEALRQSILKKAFEGLLLSRAELDACRKEADWEPAEILLERIKRAKE